MSPLTQKYHKIPKTVRNIHSNLCKSKRIFVSKRTNIRLVISNEYSNIRYIRFTPNIFAYFNLLLATQLGTWSINDTISTRENCGVEIL